MSDPLAVLVIAAGALFGGAPFVGFVPPARDTAGPAGGTMGTWEQCARVLLLANDLAFVG